MLAYVLRVLMLNRPCITSGQTELLIVNNFRPPFLRQHFIKRPQFRPRSPDQPYFLSYIYILYTHTLKEYLPLPSGAIFLSCPPHS